MHPHKKNIASKLTLGISLLLAVIVFSSCRTNKTVSTKAPAGDESWTTLYTAVNVEMSKPSRMSVSGRLTMANGQYIHLSMRFLGMEVASAYLDNDSAYFVDKYHRYIFAEPLADVLGSDYSHLSLTDIQNIFLGRERLKDSSTASVTPSDFINTAVGSIASRLSLSATSDKGEISGAIDWKPLSAKWNEPDRTVNFKVPTNYTRITTESLRSILKSLTF